ncbi:hypothetical protein V6N11_000722 [Hibiscus sabdariffa]|uniref:ClpA/ClpB AAA lid domain-containing protein n=1 Tax=Hibiscus sabdariffa TaxID=183260 RepID=A0ABR2RXS8_9ROSI
MVLCPFVPHLNFCILHACCSDGFLPDKAIDLFDKAGALVSAHHAKLLEVARELGAELRPQPELRQGTKVYTDRFYVNSIVLSLLVS